MSTIKTDTLQNVAGTKSVPVNTVVDGSAKAWVNFNGTGTVAIRAAFNVSSITDHGTGDYTVNFTNAMPDASYAYLVTHNAVNSGGQATQTITANKSAGAMRLTTQAGGVGVADGDQVNVAIFR